MHITLLLTEVDDANYLGSLNWTLLAETVFAVRVLLHIPLHLHPLAVEWSGLSTTEPQPITWEPQLPASHQIKWISNWVKAPSQNGEQAGFCCSSTSPDFLFIICFSLSISNCVQPLSSFFSLHSPHSVSLIC